MEEHPVVKVGGSIEEAVKGDYSLDVAAILKEAWQITLKSRLAINLGLFTCLIIGMLVSVLVSSQLLVLFMVAIQLLIKKPSLSPLTLKVTPFRLMSVIYCR